ncbi:MAG: 4'-phosphopantetheinyl transferase superfamily protein [Acutalibacteraceae bacterium]|nr:4'-phosphopantetheinyl transferase superfamily protein [Acutalibacteraceae bacterium]
MIISISDIRKVKKSELSAWFEQMSDERKQAVSQMKVEHKRNLRIAADALCRKTIADFCGVEQNKIIFEHTKTGKPFAKDLPVHFNVSHSGDMVVCAVSDCEIGIDIEKIRNINPRTAEKFATESEKDYISKNKNGFFEIWTLKEAYFKCIGTGLGADIRDVSFDIGEKKILCSENGFECSFIETDADYICSVCKRIKNAP